MNEFDDGTKWRIIEFLPGFYFPSTSSSLTFMASKYFSRAVRLYLLLSPLIQLLLWPERANLMMFFMVDQLGLLALP